MANSGQSAREQRTERVEQRLAIPVLLAALVSVPAVFLTTADGTAARVGTVLNWLSMVVIVGESLLLLVVSGTIVRWLRRYKWQLLVAALTVPAVILSIGPVQVLRVVLALGAFRILRARRIVQAGLVVRDRANLHHRTARAVVVVLSVLAAAFVAVVLADPTSASRRLAEWTIDHLGVFPAVLAGLLLAGATFIVLRYRRTRRTDDQHLAGTHSGGQHTADTHSDHDGQHPDGQHTAGSHPSGQHTAGTHTADSHSAGTHPDGDGLSLRRRPDRR